MAMARHARRGRGLVSGSWLALSDPSILYAIIFGFQRARPLDSGMRGHIRSAFAGVCMAVTCRTASRRQKLFLIPSHMIHGAIMQSNGSKKRGRTQTCNHAALILSSEACIAM